MVKRVPRSGREDLVSSAPSTTRVTSSCWVWDWWGSGGDFARGFRVDPLLGGKPVASLMTRHPITVQSEALAVEVLRTLGQNRIDDIVVLDEAGKPVGLIDTQDLARLKIV